MVIGFFYPIHNDSLPRPTGKEKNRCRAGCFRALNIHIPAAVLRNQGRRIFCSSLDILGLRSRRLTGGRRHAVLLSLRSNPLLPLKKSPAPPQENSGHEYVLYHVNEQQNTSNHCPVGLRPAGLFLSLLAARSDQKNFLKIIQKDGVQRVAKSLSGVMLAERDRTTTSPTERG